MRKKHIVAGVIVCAALGVILFQGLSGCSVKSYTVSELLDKADTTYGKTVQVRGEVAQGSLIRHVDATRLDFILVDENGVDLLPVTYCNAEPDDFREGRGVVVKGELASDGTFTAIEVLTSCASKYVPEE